MARRYNRDKLGRFSSKGVSRKPVIKSIKAHDTRAVGKMERIPKGSRKLMPTPRLRRGNSGMTKAQLTRRIQRTYRGDPQGLKSDIRISRRRRESLSDLIGI